MAILRCEIHIDSIFHVFCFHDHFPLQPPQLPQLPSSLPSPRTSHLPTAYLGGVARPALSRAAKQLPLWGLQALPLQIYANQLFVHQPLARNSCFIAALEQAQQCGCLKAEAFICSYGHHIWSGDYFVEQVAQGTILLNLAQKGKETFELVRLARCSCGDCGVLINHWECLPKI